MGLLRAGLTKSGRRCSTTHDVIRLQQILFLKSFGVPLDEIKSKLLISNAHFRAAE
jgi:DNA-binding transcriptional MerR regulator